MIYKTFKIIIAIIAYAMLSVAALGFFAFSFSVGMMLIHNVISGVFG